MNTTLRLKTNLNCNSCVAKVRPHLDGDPAIKDWNVDISIPEKTLTVRGDDLSLEHVQDTVAKSGFKVLGEMPANSLPVVTASPQQPLAEPSPTTYYPLLLLVSYLIGIVALVEYASGGFVWERAMRHFMGGFFLAFSFFKLLDIRGFADSYRMYDIVAQKVPVYGYIYPLVELLLGAAYIGAILPVLTNWITLVVMSVSIVGVIQSLLQKRKIRCACLGTVFNLPMSTVTFVEDGLMIAMAAFMLISGSHG